MNVLLDSHVVLWWYAESSHLSRTARRVIDDALKLFVSPISCWEIALLSARKRVRLDRDVYEWTNEVLNADRVSEAPLSPSAAISAALMGSEFPGDPADRFLYATAKDLGIPLVTRDESIRGYARTNHDVRVIW
ncbi:MAG: type II toxin-antitoxin system VapC family toxin [Actinomycetota bacterium]|nr:type II toxin-antitoxin system VapC family toxin [Actinomycetota bacterium]